MNQENFGSLEKAITEEVDIESKLKPISPSLYKPRRQYPGKVDSIVVDINVFKRALDTASYTFFLIDDRQRKNFEDTWGEDTAEDYFFLEGFGDYLKPAENIRILKNIDDLGIELCYPDYLKDCIDWDLEYTGQDLSESMSCLKTLLDEDLTELEIKKEMGIEGEEYRSDKIDRHEDQYLVNKITKLDGFTPLMSYDSNLSRSEGVLAMSPRSMYEFVK